MSMRLYGQAKLTSMAPVPLGLLQRKCACGGTPGPTGECAACRRKRPGIQPKLTINQPGDKYEREADRVAEQVMRMPEPHLQRLELIEEEEEETRLQTKSVRQGQTEVIAAPPIVPEVLRSAGNPLGPTARAFMEPRFGHDFGQVRVHTDARAAESAKAVQARAYTVGRNVVFGARQYAPATTVGRQLLAHELTHVVQQSQRQSTPHLQRVDWGPAGGKCCNESLEGDEWALVGDGTWKLLAQDAQDACTEVLDDCDGMTCGGGFYFVRNLQHGVCRTPRQDDATFRDRRWTPNAPRSEAMSPTQRGSHSGDTPPLGYRYDE